MKEIVSTVTGKGQVTIPVEIRRRLQLGQGDKVSFVVEDDGTIQLKVPRYHDVASLVSAAGTLPEPLSWEQMREIAREDCFDARQSDV